MAQIQAHFMDGWGVLVDTETNQIIDHGYRVWPNVEQTDPWSLSVQRPTIVPRPKLFIEQAD